MNARTAIDLDELGIKKREILEQLGYYSYKTLRHVLKQLQGELDG